MLKTINVVFMISALLASGCRIPESYADIGERKLLERDYYDARHYLTEAIAESPHRSDLYVMRGLAYKGTRNYPKAVEDFTRAIELDPANRDAYYHRAVIKNLQADYRGALEDLTVATLDAQSKTVAPAEFFNQRGIASLRLGSAGNARRDFANAVHLSGGREYILVNHGIAYNAEGLYDLALKNFDQALRRNSQDGHAHLNRAIALFGLKQFAESCAAFKKAMTYTGEPIVRPLLAVTLIKAGREVEARELLEGKPYVTKLAPEEQTGDEKVLYATREGSGLTASGELANPEWEKYLEALILGAIKAESVLTHAITPERKAEYFFFAGARALYEGDEATAEYYFKKCVEMNKLYLPATVMAAAEIKFLNDIPTSRDEFEERNRSAYERLRRNP